MTLLMAKPLSLCRNEVPDEEQNIVLGQVDIIRGWHRVRCCLKLVPNDMHELSNDYFHLLLNLDRSIDLL
jgi:hypothetical protein